jgi:hypothetical protein
MEHLYSDEAKKKRQETLANNLRQVAELEEQETDVVLDYREKKIMLYTNRATIMNRLERAGYKYEKQDTVDGEIYSRSYVFPLEDVGKFMRTGIFG